MYEVYWEPCGADGRTYVRTYGRSRDYYVTTKISWLDWLPNFLSAGSANTFLKRKRIASISMAHIEDIGELEGKISLFEDIFAFFKAKEIWKVPGDFRLDFQDLLSVQW